MPDSFTFRWAILADYAGQDENGKLIIAGGYTEDLVFQTVPDRMPNLVLTICLAPKKTEFKIELAVIKESGHPIFEVSGKLVNEGALGERDRATFRMPFPEGSFPGFGTYIVLLGDTRERLEEVHRFSFIGPTGNY